MKRMLGFTCLAVVVGATPFAVWAADEKAEAKPESAVMTTQEKADYAKRVALFSDVASYGETQKDPLVLLTAVKMLDDLPFGGIAKAGAKDASGTKYDRAGLLSLAKTNAAGDAELLAVITKLEEAPEPTTVRGRHRDDDFGPGHYYNRRYHPRRYGCDWYEECHHGRCEWVCGRR